MTLLPQQWLLLILSVIIAVGCVSVAVHDLIERRGPGIVRWWKQRWAR